MPAITGANVDSTFTATMTVAGPAARIPTQLQHGASVLLSSPAFLSSIETLNLFRSHLPRFSKSLHLILKTLLYLVILFNIRSIPGGWHWRVFWPVTKLRLQYLAARTRNSLGFISNSRKERNAGMEIAMEKWLESKTPVGAHPFEFETRYRTWVSE